MMVGGAEIKIDCQGKFWFFNNLLESWQRSLGGDAVFRGSEAAEIDVDEFLFDCRPGVAHGVNDTAPIRVFTIPGGFYEERFGDGFGDFPASR